MTHLPPSKKAEPEKTPFDFWRAQDLRSVFRLAFFGGCFAPDFVGGVIQNDLGEGNKRRRKKAEEMTKRINEAHDVIGSLVF